MCFARFEKARGERVRTSPLGAGRRTLTTEQHEPRKGDAMSPMLRETNAREWREAVEAEERAELVARLRRFNPFGGYCEQPCSHPGHSTESYRETVERLERRRP